MDDIESLRNLVLAPYIFKATALIGVSRRVGGNQFRHAFSTLGILFDYKYFQDRILLKASLIHDLIEDLPETQIEDLRHIDEDGYDVVNLVLEVSKMPGESKPEYLQRILENSSEKALILKCADRISNLTDLHRDTDSDIKITEYLDQTEKYIVPMAIKVNQNMVIELTDLISRRRNILDRMNRHSQDNLNDVNF